MTDEKKRVLEFFAEGRKMYKLMRFAEAKEKFILAIALDPKDGPSKVYLERCIQFIQNPPPEDWDGVFTMTHK